MSIPVRSSGALGKDTATAMGRMVPNGPTILNMAPPAAQPKARSAPVVSPGSNQRPQGPEMAAYIEHNKKDSKGNIITKRYAKGALLGKGGFAKCYQVTDVDTKEEYACKVIAKASLTKQRHKQKLQTEIKIHRSQSHPHIVRFEDVFEDRDNVYIIMELCTNQTMLELVKRKRRLTEADTRRFMLQLLDGVKYMHNNNVIHRDLKLGNLFLGSGDVVKIGDFGLACKLEFDGERKKTLCGTPNYIAPEVLESKNGHSFEVDTWSIGVVLFTCLVGKPPFETADVKSTYKLIKSNTYSFPQHSQVAEAAKSLVRRILQSRPESRPSIDAIIADPFFAPEIQYAPSAGVKAKEALMDALMFSSDYSAAQRANVENVCSERENRPVSAHRAISSEPGLASALSRATTAISGSLHGHDVAASALERNVSTAASSVRGTSAGDFGSANLVGQRTPQKIALSEAAKPYAHDNKRTPPRPVSATMRRFEEQQQQQQQQHVTGASPRLTTPSTRTPIMGTEGHGSGFLGSKVASRPASISEALSTASTSSAPSSARGLQAGDFNSISSNQESRKGDVGKTPTAAASSANDREDFGALQMMHSNLENLFNMPPSKMPVIESKGNLPLPTVWVSRWVDYSKKYGLGYTLCDGRYGVFFNDATKILLSLDKDAFNYVERHKAADGSKFDVVNKGNISTRGADLAKKVTLLEHFRNYLDENNANSDEATTPARATRDTDAELVYVRKWMRTRHSVIFRLSNNNFQVNFFDETEVFVWADKKLITFKAKKKPRVTYDLQEVPSNPEVAKRVKYVRDILAQLVSTLQQ